MEHLEGKYVVIRADASTEIGTGHLMRSLALAQAWKDAGGQVVFITACQNEGLLQRLQEESDVHRLAHPYPHLGDWEYTKDILATYPNAWAVLDGYQFDELYQQQVRELGHRLLVVDDMAHLKHYYADLVLNQNLHAEGLHYSCGPDTCLLLGTRYVLLRREFLAWKDFKREIPEVARRVLVTLGGGDPENYTLKIIQALQKVDVPSLEATVVIGASNPNVDVLEAATRQSRIPIRITRDARNMPELMTEADIAVAGAGSTVWELAFMGLPSIILVLSDNQGLIAKELAAAGVAVNLGWSTGVDSAAISKALSQLAQMAETRRGMSRQGQQLIDGGGGQRVLKFLREKRGAPKGLVIN